MMKTKADAVLSAKSLHYFLQLIDSMSYTQAAQILGITQPALTQQIKKLEKAVGSPLFSQVGKKLCLTDAGIKMEETAHELFDTVNGAVDTIQRYTQSDIGAINIGVLSSMETKEFEDFLIKFSTKFPDVKLNVTSYNRKELWDKLDKNEELDIGLLYVPDHHANVHNMKPFLTKIIKKDSYIILSPDKNERIEDLLSKKWVSYTATSYLASNFRRYYSGILPEKGLQIRARFSSPDQVIRFAQATGSPTFTTRSYYETHKSEIKLNPVPLESVVDFNSCFIYRKNKAKIPRLTNFLDEWDKFAK